MTVKRFALLASFLVLVASACSGDDSSESTTTSGNTPGSSTTTSAGFAGCEGAVPIFPTALPAADALNVDGTDGPGPGSIPPLEGQVVRHWQRDLGVTIEVRWPATPLPADAVSEATGAGPFEAVVALPATDDASGRTIAIVDVPVGTPPCNQVSVEAFGPQPGPIGDELFSFLDGLRDASQKEAYVAEVIAARSPVTPDPGRPAGACALPVVTAVGDTGQAEESASRRLIEAFLSDRLAGNAADACLTVTALQDFEAGDSTASVPGPCLFACEGPISLIDGEVDRLSGDTGQLLVTYEYEDGTTVRLRESLRVVPVPDGAGGHIALIDSVWVGPESYVDASTARRVIGDFLDAVAAGQYEIAATYLVNEGFSDEVERRLGNLFEQSPTTLFTAFCRNAACGAPYEIRETTEAEEFFRTVRVTFQTTRGPVDVLMRTGMFEGVTTLGSLPPEGEPLERAQRIDERLFGDAYTDPLFIERLTAVQFITAATDEWAISYPMRFISASAATDDHLVVANYPSMGGGVFAVGLDGAFTQIAPSPAELAGAGEVGDRHLAFVVEGQRLDAIDLHDGTRTTIVDLEGRDETAYAADAASGRLLITLGAGESTWLELYPIEESNLELGRLIKRIDPAGALGTGHLSRDASTIVATLDDSFYDPVRSIALFDAAGGEVIGRWTVGGGASLGALDYDGHWVVAEVNDGTLFVVDTIKGDVRQVDSGVAVRFG